MKRIFLLTLVLCLFPCGVLRAQGGVLDPEVKEVCNQAILNIYYDILALKDRHKELADFNEKAVYENPYGLYAIVYEYSSGEKTPHQQPFAFAVTIDAMEDDFWGTKRGAFRFEYPVLGLKFSGYQQKHRLRTQFDLPAIVEKHGILVSEYQQRYLPLRLVLVPVKEEYYVREDIEFEVLLINISKRHMIVKPLGQETLFFLFNNQTWGTRPSEGVRTGKDIILKAGETLRRRFKGESFQNPKEITIYSLYRMSIHGVNPFATLKVNILDRPL